MSTRRKWSLKTVIMAAALSVMACLAAEESQTPVVKSGGRVAVIGDSITEQKLYSRFIELYLTACSGVADVKTMQFGWSGETAAGFAARMENDLMPWRPSLATTCYGMNDGGYRAYDEKTIGANYKANMEKIIKFLKEKGVKVIVGSPGAVDTATFKRAGTPAAVYNDNLEQLAKIDKDLAAANGELFADLHAAMMSAMAKAKAALGDSYHVAGGDGFHPWQNGQLVMAYAFLKAMCFDGNIATVEMDMKDNKTIVSDGHKVISQEPGAAEIESSRWPFCFTGSEKDPNGTVSILPFVPFQADLNRFTLKVKNLPSDKAELSWGDKKKTFSKDQLEKGVNLAAEFIENPFSAPFAKLSNAVAAKQAFETWMIKGLVTNFRQTQTYMPADKEPEFYKAYGLIKDSLWKRQAAMEAAARAEFVPVKHKITVTPAK